MSSKFLKKGEIIQDEALVKRKDTPANTIEEVRAITSEVIVPPAPTHPHAPETPEKPMSALERLQKAMRDRKNRK